jgi:CheY-like chemotaxis protein
VEDTRVLQAIQKKMLSTLGAVVEIAEDGSKAVDMFTNSLETASGGASEEDQADAVALPYDVIFMDCQVNLLFVEQQH